MSDRYLSTRTGDYCVDGDGVIRRFDDVAGYYTIAGDMPEGRAQYIRARAKAGNDRPTTEPEAARRAFGWD